MLALESATYRYAGSAGPALVELTLALGPGEVVGVVGATDAGKSTLCLVASGLAPRVIRGHLTGSVTLDGAPIGSLPLDAVIGAIGIAFQNPASQLTGVAPTVYEEVAFGPMNLGLERAAVMDRTERALGVVGIADLARRDPEHLSGGQQQLVALAGLLAMEPRHLVLDEPTAHLDPAGTRLVGEAIGRLATDGASILIAEQKTDLLAAICQRVVALDRGTVALAGRAEAVFADPRLAALGVDPPTAVRLRSRAVSAGVDPTVLEAVT